MSTQNQATDTSQPQILPSFVKGEWWRPEDPQKVADVRNAATGELVARVSTDGIDTAGAVEYARTVGQASLGTLRIHDRALILKQLAQYLGEHKEELYEISYATGATAKDHLIDIDTGDVIEFSSDAIEELQRRIAAELGYELVRHRLAGTGPRGLGTRISLCSHASNPRAPLRLLRAPITPPGGHRVDLRPRICRRCRGQAQHSLPLALTAIHSRHY